MANKESAPWERECITDEEWVRDWKRAVDETRLRAAKLPAKQRQMIPVIKAPTGGKP